jgi:drug/metabolite transporter (DMT)-like permease
VGFGLLAATCFGSLFVFVDEAAKESVLWGVLVGRIAAVAIVAAAVIAVRHRVAPKRKDLPALLAIGAVDMTANVLLGAATTLGLLSVAAVLISLHILVTIGLARVVLHERLTPAQRVGVVAATLGAVMLSAA